MLQPPSTTRPTRNQIALRSDVCLISHQETNPTRYQIVPPSITSLSKISTSPVLSSVLLRSITHLVPPLPLLLRLPPNPPSTLSLPSLSPSRPGTSSSLTYEILSADPLCLCPIPDPETNPDADADPEAEAGLLTSIGDGGPDLTPPPVPTSPICSTGPKTPGRFPLLIMANLAACAWTGVLAHCGYSGFGEDKWTGLRAPCPEG